MDTILLGDKEPLHQCNPFVHYRCKERRGEKTTEPINLDFEHSKEKRVSVQGCRKIFDRETEISPLGQRTVRNLSEPFPHFKLGADSEKSMAESEGRDTVEKTLTPTIHRRAENSGETQSLPTVHEGEMSNKLRNPVKQKRRPRSISESSIEQLALTPHTRPPSPHPSSPRPRPRSISMNALTNTSILQRQASENNFRQNRTRKISCPATFHSSVKYRESPSPRLLRRSWSTDTVHNSDNFPVEARPQLRQRSYSDNVPQGFARSVELGGPFCPRRKLGFNSPCSSPGLRRRENRQFMYPDRDFHVSTNISTLNVDESCSSSLSPKDIIPVHALVPMARTPTPVVSRTLPFRPDSAQNSPSHLCTNPPRRLRPLSPIQMPLDAAHDLFNVSPLMTCSGVDVLSPQTNESHLAQERIADFFKKMTIEGSSKADGKT